MLLYKSHYLTVNYIETKYLSHLQWTQPADLLDQVGYYSEIVRFYEKKTKRRAHLLLWDMKIIQHRIDKKFIDWLEQYILPNLLSIKAEKIAYVISSELASSLKQGERNFGNTSLQLKIFSSTPEAMQWLTEGIEPIIRGPHQQHHH